MGTPIQSSMFDILREVGVAPEKAHAFDRAWEARHQEVQEMIDQRVKDLATKQDLDNGLINLRNSLKADILKAMNDQTWKLVTFVVVTNAAMLGILRLFKF